MKARICLGLCIFFFSYPLLASLDSELLTASLESDLDQVKKLVSNGANVNARNEKNLTPIMQAAKHDSWDDPAPIIQVLIDAGADVNARDSKGRSTLMRVIIKEDQSRYFSIISTLLKNGAEVNARDNQQDTALMIALNHGKHESVKFLLKNNALPYLKDANGNDSYALANVNRALHRHDPDFTLAKKALLAYGDAYVSLSDEKIDDNTFRFIANASFMGRGWIVISNKPGVVIGKIIRKRRTFIAKIEHKGDYLVISWLPEYKKYRTNYLHNLRVDIIKIIKINKLKHDMDPTNKH